MKKSIKYAGIAAATLLAVAPVAAPVVSQAAANDATTTEVPTTDQSKQDAAVEAFGKQFTEQKASAVDGTKVTLGTVNVDKFADSNSGLNLGTALTADQISLLNSKGQAKATVSANYDGVAITTQADLVKVLKDTTYPAVTFTITLNYNDLNGKAQSKTYTVKADRDKDTVVSKMTQANATFTTPVNVALNSTTTATTLDVSNDATIKDQDGNSVLTATDNVSAAAAFYDTYSAAMDAAAGKTDVTTTAATNVGTNTDVNNGITSFLKGGTYYQVITFTAAEGSDLGNFLGNYTSDPATYSVTVNGKKASAGYDFVNAGDKVSFVRAINVSNSVSDWKTTKVSGVVTTKNAADYYTLKNNDNNTIKNRALAANSGWRTNAVRVDQNGNKQYRVGASEWIDANDVTFSDKAVDNGEGAYTDVKALNGKVVTAGPSGFVYPLFDDNGKQVTNRAVAGDTAWYTDKSAVNAEGTTVYHVATGEWLQGNNVTYSAY